MTEQDLNQKPHKDSLLRLLLPQMTLFLIFLVLILGLPRTTWAQSQQELVFIFQKQKDPALLKAEAEAVGAALSKKLGLVVKTQVPSDYAASVQALVSKKADLAYVDSMGFLLAERDGGATLLLAEERKDPRGVPRTEYDSIFVSKADSSITSFEDIIKSPKDVRIAFTSPTSTSGYLIPFSRFVDAGVLKPKQDPKEVFKSASFGGSYDQALKQVLQGRADVAAVSYYTMEGESAEKYLPKEERASLKIIARTPGVPTHVLIARGGLDQNLKEKIITALLSLSSESPELLKDVYGTASFVRVESSKHVQATKTAAERLGIYEAATTAVAKGK